MKYVGVRHKPEHTNLFWFYVPESLSHLISVGQRIVCDTRKGKTTGVVVQIIDGFIQAEATRIIGDYFPLKPVVGLEMDFEIDEIHIPWDIQECNPDPEDIAACIRRLYSGYQTAQISCTPDGNLHDGYPEYLVAKMFGHDTIRGFCFAE